VDDRGLEQTESEVRSRFDRDLRSLSVRPYAHYRSGALARIRPSRAPLRLASALAAAAAVILLALFLGNSLADVRRNAAASPSPSAAPSASPAGSPSPSPTATPPPTPLPSGRPAGGIEAYPLGALRGDYAFVQNGSADTLPGAIAEVWAVPLAGGQAKLVVRYANSGLPRTSTGDNVLAHQFSPDGRRLLIAAATPRTAGGEHVGLFIVDLETGRISPVATDDSAEYEKPKWSPDGRRIAYIRRPIFPTGITSGPDDGIWVMNVDGSGARKMPLTPGPESHTGPPRVELYSWTPDGRIAWFWPSLENVLTFTDIDTGAHSVVRSGVGDIRGLSFRSIAPRLAGSFSDKSGNCPGNFIAVLDGAPEQVLVRETGGVQCPPRVHDVRWSPTRDEILYVREVAPKSELHIHGLAGGDQRIAAETEPLLAEWSTDGSHVVYVARSQTQFTLPLRGGELRVVARDGSGDQLLFAPSSNASLADLATRAYP
jgi:hypothetical protein